MKFSYPLLKKLVPGLPNQAKFSDVINLKAFEVEEAVDVLDGLPTEMKDIDLDSIKI